MTTRQLAQSACNGTRRRRFADPARVRWYARHRQLRFARRFGFGS